MCVTASALKEDLVCAVATVLLRNSTAYIMANKKL